MITNSDREPELVLDNLAEDVDSDGAVESVDWCCQSNRLD
jgi:hypothetical protein